MPHVAAVCTSASLCLPVAAVCTRFEPALDKWLAAAADAGTPVELVYVPSDRDEAQARVRAKQLGMLQVRFDAADELKRRAGVWSGSEMGKFGFFGRRSGVPALSVLDPTGKEMAFLEAERRGPVALKQWPADPRGQW